ncbi:MAG: hypothetical protein ACJAV1_002424 [Paraglaciecola sp.]|jgi:hypothetical protein
MPIKINFMLSVLLLVWLVSLQGVKADVVHDLYDANIAMDDQSQRNQNKAFSLALEQVLIKIRGNHDLLTHPKIKLAITKATRFVRSYSYDIQGSQLYLVISFDPQRVEDVIRSAGFPVWDKRRPDSLIWLAIESRDDSARKIATPTEYSDIYQQLSDRAAKRGITLSFPLWDLGDVQSLGVYDIWGGFSTQISQASERYAVPSILSARIYFIDNELYDVGQSDVMTNAKPAGQWSADWTMIEGGGLLAGQVQGDNPLIVAEGLIDALADQLSMKYAIDLSQIDQADTKAQIVVNNINSLIYYSQALTFLENMSVVNSATLIKLQGPRATFELDLLGDVGDLTNAFGLDNKISPVVDDFGQPVMGLEFFWVK